MRTLTTVTNSSQVDGRHSQVQNIWAPHDVRQKRTSVTPLVHTGGTSLQCIEASTETHECFRGVAAPNRTMVCRGIDVSVWHRTPLV